MTELSFKSKENDTLLHIVEPTKTSVQWVKLKQNELQFSC